MIYQDEDRDRYIDILTDELPVFKSKNKNISRWFG